MSSSLNSETTHSVTRDKKTFEKYGFTVEMGIQTTTRPGWGKVYRDPDGEVIKQEDLAALAEKLDAEQKSQRITVDWELTGNDVECSKIVYAHFSDKERCTDRPLLLIATPEGPVMGISNPGSFTDVISLIDPCIVQYDGKGKINLLPIFNVVDDIEFSKSAVRNIQTPNEILVALYPGFVMQNRMLLTQLRPKVPFAETPELETGMQ